MQFRIDEVYYFLYVVGYVLEVFQTDRSRYLGYLALNRTISCRDRFGDW